MRILVLLLYQKLLKDYAIMEIMKITNQKYKIYNILFYKTQINGVKHIT